LHLTNADIPLELAETQSCSVLAAANCSFGIRHFACAIGSALARLMQAVFSESSAIDVPLAMHPAMLAASAAVEKHFACASDRVPFGKRGKIHSL